MKSNIYIKFKKIIINIIFFLNYKLKKIKRIKINVIYIKIYKLLFPLFNILKYFHWDKYVIKSESEII